MYSTHCFFMLIFVFLFRFLFFFFNHLLTPFNTSLCLQEPKLGTKTSAFSEPTTLPCSQSGLVRYCKLAVSPISYINLANLIENMAGVVCSEKAPKKQPLDLYHLGLSPTHIQGFSKSH